VCDLETSRMGVPYIYDISRLSTTCGPVVHTAINKYYNSSRHFMSKF